MRTPELTAQQQRELDALEAALAGREVDPEVAEWAELARALRDERPAIDARFAAELDARDFEQAARRSKRSRRARLALVPAVAASALLALAVTTSLLDGGSLDESTSRSDSSAGSVSSEQSGAGSGVDAVAAPEVAGDPDQRLVERSALLSLAVAPDDVDSVSSRVQAVAESAGGYVQSSSVNTGPEGAGGNFELRVPVERLDRSMAELARLGKVRERSQSSQDITAIAVSAQEQLEDAQAERRSLLADLRRAEGDRERLRLRERLRAVSREIATLRATLRNAENRAAFALVSVSLFADSEAGGGSGGSGWTPGDALRDAVRILEIAAGVLVVALAAGLPLALVAATGWLAVRLLTRRRRAIG